MNKIHIFSLGINSYGGKKILEFIIRKYQDHELILYADNRLIIDKNFKNIKLKKYKNNFYNHNHLYLKLKKFKNDKILFLNGLPPFYSFKDYNAVVFFQNKNIYDIEFSFKNIFNKDLIKKIYFNCFKKNVSNWCTFNLYTSDILQKLLNTKSNINVLNFKPFIDFKINYEKKIYDFFYLASSSKNKNHSFLLTSLIELSKIGYRPKIFLTLYEDEFEKLYPSHILKKYNLNIINKYIENDDTLYKIYSLSKNLIFPSTSETLAIPLFEAEYFGLNIYLSDKINFFYTNKVNIYYFDTNNIRSLVNLIIDSKTNNNI